MHIGLVPVEQTLVDEIDEYEEMISQACPLLPYLDGATEWMTNDLQRIGLSLAFRSPYNVSNRGAVYFYIAADENAPIMRCDDTYRLHKLITPSYGIARPMMYCRFVRPHRWHQLTLSAFSFNIKYNRISRTYVNV